MDWREAFAVAPHRAVQLIGAGGKTSLMFALARASRSTGERVITTTTTRIREPGPAESPALVLLGEGAGAFARIEAALRTHGHVTVAASRIEAEGKLAGLSLGALAALLDAGLADRVIVEADGARGRSLKAHAPHEPSLLACGGAVIAVVGADVLGRPLDEAHVHRAMLLAERLGVVAGSLVSPETIVGALLGPGGGLARVPAEAETSVFVSHAAGGDSRAAARSLAAALLRADTLGRITRVVIGDTHEPPGGTGPERAMRAGPAPIA